MRRLLNIQLLIGLAAGLVLFGSSVLRAEEPLTTLAQRIAGDEPVREIERQPLGTGPYTVKLESGLDETAPTGVGSWLSVVGALGLVVGLIFVTRLVLARFAQRGGATAGVAVQVIGRTAIGPRNTVLLIRVGGRVLVVSDSSGGMRTLANIDNEEEVASLLALSSGGTKQSSTAGFSSLLKTFHGKQESDERSADDSWTVDQTREQLGRLLGRVKQVGQLGQRGVRA